MTLSVSMPRGIVTMVSPMRFLVMCLSVYYTAAVETPPTPMTCNDPRFKAGGNLLGGYVTENELSKDVVFEAIAGSDDGRYHYGKPVQFRVSAGSDSRVRREPQGVYLALQVEFTGADGEAQGHFHDLSPPLVGQFNCASSLFTPDGTPFNGSSPILFSWTPTDRMVELQELTTIGNATFKLLWANAPKGGVADPYVYLKQLTLQDPTPQHSRPQAIAPTPPHPASACVLPAHPSAPSPRGGRVHSSAAMS